MRDGENHQTGTTSKKATSARPVTSSGEQMTDMDMECCFCKREGSRSYLKTRRHAAGQNVAEFIDEGDIFPTSTDRPSIEIVEIVRRTVWVEKGSKRQLKDLLHSLVSFVEDSHRKSNAADESETKLPDHDLAGIINSELLKEEPHFLEPSKHTQSCQLVQDHVGSKPAAAEIVTKLDNVPCSESKATEVFRCMRTKKSKTKCKFARHGDSTFTADDLLKVLELQDVACANSKDSEPSTSMTAQRAKTNGHSGSGGMNVHAPHGSMKESEIVEFKFPGLIKVTGSWETHSSDTHAAILHQSITPARPADHGGISVKHETMDEAGGLNRIDVPRSLNGSKKSKKSKKKGSSSSRRENAHGIVTPLDGVATSIRKSVGTSPSLKAKKLERHPSSSSGGENDHGRNSLAADKIVMKLEGIVASGVLDSVELPPSVKVSTLRKNSPVSSPDDNTCGKDIIAADGILTKLEENVCEYLRPPESRPAVSTKKRKKNRSYADQTGENAHERKGLAPEVVVFKQEPVPVESSMSFESPRPVKVKKPKEQLHSNSSGGILRHRNNPAIQDFIRELKKEVACCHQKLLNSTDSTHMTKPKVKRCSDDGFVGSADEATTHLADGIVKELDDGAACAYSKSFELPHSLKIEKRKKKCHHESGTENVHRKNIPSADGVGTELACRSSKSSEVYRPRILKKSKQCHVSISGGQNAIEKNSTPAYDGAVIRRDNHTCSSLQFSGTSPFKANKFREKRNQDDAGDSGHARTIDAHDGNVTKLEDNDGAWLDSELLQTRPLTKKQRKRLQRNGYQDGVGEITHWRKVAMGEGNAIDSEIDLFDAKSPTSRSKLKGSKMKRHRRGHESSSLSSSDEDISQFDFKDEDPPLFLFRSTKGTKKKVRFALPEEGEMAEEERTKRSSRKVQNIPDTPFGKCKQEGDETIKKCVDTGIEERDRDNAKGNNNEGRGTWLDIVKCLPNRPVKRVISGACGLLERENPRKWSEEEEEKMRTLLLQYGPAWKKIGRILDRPAEVCMDKWRTLRLTPLLKTGPWTQMEQDQLQTYVLEGLEAKQKLAKKEVDRSQWRRKDVNWEEIAIKMNRRSKACAYIWYKKICPRLLNEKSDGVSVSGFPRSALKKQSSFE